MARGRLFSEGEVWYRTRLLALEVSCSAEEAQSLSFLENTVG